MRSFLNRLAGLAALCCFSHALAAQDINAATEDVCACLEDPYKMVEAIFTEIAAAQTSGDFSRFIKHQKEMEKASKSAKKCFDRVEKAYPEISASPALKKQVMESTETACPNPIDNLQL